MPQDISQTGSSIQNMYTREYTFFLGATGYILQEDKQVDIQIFLENTLSFPNLKMFPGTL